MPGKGLVIDGIEANPEWAEMARPYYRNVWAGIVEDARCRAARRTS